MENYLQYNEYSLSTSLNIIIEGGKLLNMIGDINPIPSCVKQRNESYTNSQNMFYNFVQERLIEIQDQNQALAAENLYNIFRSWVKEKYNGYVQAPNINDFGSELATILAKKRTKNGIVYLGYKLK